MTFRRLTRLVFVAVLLALSADSPAADADSELVLSRDFRVSELRRMPGPAVHPGLRFEKRDYPEENAAEWQVRLQAPAAGESSLVEDVKSADFVVRFPAPTELTLHWSKGSHAEPSDFEPRIDGLASGKPVVLESFGGRSSDGIIPYFNLASADGGLIVAVGWTGDWKASFESLGDGCVRVSAGLKRSRFRLLPGEEVRLPSVLVMSYRGDWLDGQNQFRRLMLCYQDCNLYPAHYWQTAEPPDAVGLREVRYITGLYAFLDELARRHPGLILDNCASGGRRLDFEMMRRCVVLWRSDSCWGAPSFPRNVQAMTHGLSLWFPLHGLGAAATDDTALRSGMGSCASFAINFRDSVAVETLRRHLVRYRKVRPLFTKDYYPLTPWTTDATRLLAFQFHDPASGEGLVQVFPGSAATERSTLLRLRGLDPAARYTFTDWDGDPDRAEFSGAELMDTGLSVATRRDQEALVLQYGPTR